MVLLSILEYTGNNWKYYEDHAYTCYYYSPRAWSPKPVSKSQPVHPPSCPLYLHLGMRWLQRFVPCHCHQLMGAMTGVVLHYLHVVRHCFWRDYAHQLPQIWREKELRRAISGYANATQYNQEFITRKSMQHPV